MSKEVNQLLKLVETTLHELHDIIREHNKKYFSDDGQKYPIPIVKDPPSYKKNNLKPGEFNPKDIGSDGYEYIEDMEEDYKKQ